MVSEARLTARWRVPTLLLLCLFLSCCVYNVIQTASRSHLIWQPPHGVTVVMRVPARALTLSQLRHFRYSAFFTPMVIIFKTPLHFHPLKVKTLQPFTAPVPLFIIANYLKNLDTFKAKPLFYGKITRLVLHSLKIPSTTNVVSIF